MGNPISMRSSATSLVCCHCILLAAGGCAALAPYASVECRDDEGCVDSYDAAPVTTAPVDSGQPLEAQLPASMAPVSEPVEGPGRLSLVATALEEFWESDAQGMYVDELLSLYVDLLAFGLIPPLRRRLVSGATPVGPFCSASVSIWARRSFFAGNATASSG